MDYEKLIQEIDAEIERLRIVRDLLQGAEGTKSLGRRKSAPATKASHKTIKRTMSPEGRKRVAEAQKKPWAMVKKRKTKNGGTGDGGYGIRV